MKTLLRFSFLFVLLVPPSLFAAEALKGPLAEYVAKPDASFKWSLKHEGKLGETSYAELILTSQTWREIEWKHQLFIIKPASVAPDTKHALLFITGGNWRDELEKPTAEFKLPGEGRLFATLAEQIKTPVAVLLHVPQQPIFDGKREDAIIALTFENFLKTGDAEWPLLLPMVKSAVRGMDAVQDHCEKAHKLKLETFTVTGASKRGWTTWLTGAVDKRAVAIAPMVIDMLNMTPQIKLQKESFGDLSEQIEDYKQRELDKHMETKAGKALQAIVDPYSYRQLLTQPKLIILGTNDPYWPLDAANLYWEGLSGQKHILYIPNNVHGLTDYPRIIGSLNALHQQARSGAKLPALDWKFENGSGKLALRVKSDVPPTEVKAWVATSKSRDFRKSKWESFDTTREAESYAYDLAVPGEGYAALFAEASYPQDGGFPYSFTTNVRIVSAGKQP